MVKVKEENERKVEYALDDLIFYWDQVKWDNKRDINNEVLIKGDRGYRWWKQSRKGGRKRPKERDRVHNNNFLYVHTFHDGDREPVFPEGIKGTSAHHYGGEKWRSKENAHTRRLPMQLLHSPWYQFYQYVSLCLSFIVLLIIYSNRHGRIYNFAKYELLWNYYQLLLLNISISIIAHFNRVIS